MAWTLAGSASAIAGVFIAAHHPLWPVPALLLFCLLSVVFAWRAGLWLVVVPACLPWLNFSPWTGWLVFEEFDLLLLAVFAGSFSRFASGRQRAQPSQPEPPDTAPAVPPGASDRLCKGMLLLLALSGLLALVRGLQDAGGFGVGWFQGYTEPLNSLRVFKSLLFGMLTLPLLRREMQSSRERAGERLALGVGLGLACVVAAVVWERAAFPGLFDFSRIYRATALFWEMHVGGGAIDAYLSMATPFAVWGLVRARRPVLRLASAGLTILAAYACLTTFSRGVYLAVLLPLLVLGGVTVLRRARSSVSMGGTLIGVSWALGLTIAGLAVAVLQPDTFMTNRLQRTEKVYQERLLHWGDAIDLLQSGTDWLLGMGLGRFPARYSATAMQGRLAGSAQLREPEAGAAMGEHFVTMRGPAPGAGNGGLFALTQRADLQPGIRYRVSMDVRADAAALLAVQLCERHLLYDRRCQGALQRIGPAPAQWQERSFSLAGRVFSPSPWYAPRLGMFSISVLNGAGAADIDNVRLMSSDGKELLANGDFSDGLAHWFPAAQYYYLPWHTDSLYLEVLVERGCLGLAGLVGLLLFALARLLFAPAADTGLSTSLALSLGGVVLVGVASSFMDVPRVAFMFYLLMFFAIQFSARPPAATGPLREVQA